MSLFPKETVQVIAQTIGISNLHDDVALALAPDIEYRMREIIQEAIKCMRHSKRSKLSTDDVNSALALRSIEPIYGFSSNDPLRFRKALGHSDLYYIDDKELDFHEIIEAPIPHVPVEPFVRTHWLAIEGVQPAIIENPPVKLDAPAEAVKRKREEPPPAVPPDGTLTVETKPAVKHVLSKELQLYFEKVTEILITSNSTRLVDEVLQSVATDAGIHPLVPYFTLFIGDEVTRGLDDISLLFSLMKLVRSLLLNPHIHIDLYLHDLIPSVLTCVMSKRLGKNSIGHWELRDFSARVIALICKSYGQAYQNLQPRVTRTLLLGFLDMKKTLPQHYGAIKGLAELGSRTVKVLLLPNLAQYLKYHFQEKGSDRWRAEARTYDAIRVYQALQMATGTCIYGELKSKAPHVFGTLDGPTQWGAKAKKPAAKLALKRPTPAPTPMEAEGEAPVPEPEKPAEADQPSTSNGNAEPDPRKTVSDAVVPQSDVMVSENGVSPSKNGGAKSSERGDGGGSKRAQANQEVLAAAWKEESEVGAIVKSVVELMGDGMQPFLPHPSFGRVLL